LTPDLVSQIEDGLACTAADYEDGLRIAAERRAKIDALLGTVDLLLTASAPGEAPAGLASTGNSAFNRIWTLLALPCVTLPTDRGPNGLPVGVQLVGRSRHDAKLLGNARWIENLLELDC
jgi:Asp-tRNA(Asn)/Glu-tRNA(Gln) amidotransferase A subunit family amidase